MPVVPTTFDGAGPTKHTDLSIGVYPSAPPLRSSAAATVPADAAPEMWFDAVVVTLEPASLL